MDLKEIINIVENNTSVYEMMKYCPYEILKHWEYCQYSSGEIICRQGERYDHFLVILEGYINIYFMAENGRKYIQSIYKSGDFVGELEIFHRKPYICFVEALTDLKILKLKQQYFLQWLKLDIHAHTFITKAICDHFYDLSQKAGEDTLYSLKKRICNYLLSCCQGKAVTANLKLEKGQLSEMFAVTSRSVNRILQYLKAEGAIEIRGDSIIIKDLSILIKSEKQCHYE
jgi:CRP-like cAMP-binding protein